MKNISLAFISLCFFTLWSCEKAGNHWNPDLNAENGNPTFMTDLEDNSIAAGKDGGIYSINVTQKTNYEWTVASSQDWVTVDVAEGESISGSKEITITVAPYDLVDQRNATVTLKEVAPKSNRTIEIAIGQTGTDPEISLDVTTLETDGMGGQFDVAITTNGATWTAVTTESWISVTPSTGQNGTVSITVSKNVDADNPNREGAVTFSAGSASTSLTVTQNGFTSCNVANNSDVIYFDEFSPCSDASVGDTWTLTDRRDGKVYTVSLLADGNYWMLEDLRFGGSPDVVADKDVFSNDNFSSNGTLGERIPDLFGDIVNLTSHGGSSVPVRSGRGYFYNWRGAMQQSDIASVGSSLEKSQGIAPAGWHIPSRGEFEDLRSKIGEVGEAWGEESSSIWKGIWGGAVDPGMSHWGRSGNYGSYWTSTEITTTQAVAWCIEAPGNVGPNNNSKIEDPILPGVAIPWMQTKSSAALIRCVKNY